MHFICVIHLLRMAYVTDSVKIPHVDTCQYFEKYHFEIFNLQPHLGIGHVYLRSTTILSYL